jgi:hypothetical protein
VIEQVNLARQRIRQSASVVFAVVVIGIFSGCTLSSESGPLQSSDSPSASAATPNADKPLPSSEEPLNQDAVISVAGVDVDGQHVSVSGYVSGIVEDGGVCTFTFTGVEAERTVTNASVANVSTTSCGLVQIPTSELARGSWQITLSYSSSSFSTTSQPLSLEIP